MQFYKLLMAICIISLYSCNKGRQLQVHNQLEKELEIQINEEVYILQPDELKTVLHNYGENTIKSVYEATTIVDTIIEVKKELAYKGLLLNVTGKPYYLVTERYESESPLSISNMLKQNPESEAYKNYMEEKQKKMLARMKVVMVDTVQMIGEIEKIPANQLLIQKDWYYNVVTDFEDTIEIYSTGSSSQLQGTKSYKKIFSESDLIDYWNSSE